MKRILKNSNITDLHFEHLEKWNGEDVISLCSKPESVGHQSFSCENQQRWESAEFWCAMKILDDFNVPRIDESCDKQYSIVGRICWLNDKTK